MERPTSTEQPLAGIPRVAVQLYLSLESHNFIVTKSNAPLYTMLGKREQWNVLPRGRVDLQQIYHVH